MTKNRRVVGDVDPPASEDNPRVLAVYGPSLDVPALYEWLDDLRASRVLRQQLVPSSSIDHKRFVQTCLDAVAHTSGHVLSKRDTLLQQTGHELQLRLDVQRP